MTTIQGMQAKAPMFGKTDAGKRADEIQSPHLNESKDEVTLGKSEKPEQESGFFGKIALAVGALIALVILGKAYVKGGKLAKTLQAEGVGSFKEQLQAQARQLQKEWQTAYMDTVKKAPQELIDEDFAKIARNFDV